MTRSEIRDFPCPSTGELCTDGRCTLERCCEDERLQVGATREAANKQQRKQRAKIMEILEGHAESKPAPPIVRRF
jgi:hypothetical protein